MFSKKAFQVFEESIQAYHVKDDVYQTFVNKYDSGIPAWALDRLSILALKIYHMREEVERSNASKEHVQKCQEKLDVLLEQKKDLSSAIDQLLLDIENGDKYMKVYKQMKMYNDDELNPILRDQKS